MAQINGTLSGSSIIRGIISDTPSPIVGSIGINYPSYMGVNVEKVGEIYRKSYKLEDTEYNGWTPSTTAKVIVASQTLSQTYPADMTSYEYMLKWSFRYDGAFNSGATFKAMPETEIAVIYQALVKRPASVANINASNFAGNACVTQFTAPLLMYWNTSGTKSYTYSASYGFYPSAVAATFSSSTSNAPNVTIKTPSISARCNSSYFATGRGSQIDQTRATVKLVGELYRFNLGSFVEGAYRDLIDAYNNDF